MLLIRSIFKIDLLHNYDEKTNKAEQYNVF